MWAVHVRRQGGSCGHTLTWAILMAPTEVAELPTTPITSPGSCSAREDSSLSFCSAGKPRGGIVKYARCRAGAKTGEGFIKGVGFDNKTSDGLTFVA